VTSYLRALDAHRDAQRKAITTRQAVTLAVADGIERHRPAAAAWGDCDLLCDHVLPLGKRQSAHDAFRAFVALDAVLPDLDDDGIRAVADALLGPEGAMP
jgi:hypothetical protein